MPARHSETSAGTSDDSETPGDRGPGRLITEGSETRQRISSATAVSNPQHWGEPDGLGALPPSWKHALLSNRGAQKAAELRVFEHSYGHHDLDAFVLCQCKQVQGSAALDLRPFKLSHDASERTEQSRHGSFLILLSALN